MHARFVLRRLGPHLVVAMFLLVSAGGLVGTMFHRFTKIPWLRPAVAFSYGMMAPYQGDVAWNNDFIAQGRVGEGEWQPIDLQRYYPQIFGEANAMQFMRSFGDDVYRWPAYMEFARQLKVREAQRGNAYDEVRLIWRQWPRSPGGFYFLAQEPFFTTEREVARVQ